MLSTDWLISTSYDTFALQFTLLCYPLCIHVGCSVWRPEPWWSTVSHPYHRLPYEDWTVLVGLFTWKNDSVGSRMLSVSTGAGLTSTRPPAWTGVLNYLWASTKIWLRAKCGSRPASSSTPPLGLPLFSSSRRLSRDTRWEAIRLIVLWSPSVMLWLHVHSKCNHYNYKLL